MRRYLNTATDRGRKFEITTPQFLELIARNCTYCNTAARDTKSGVNELSRVVDRDGYTLENLEPCCKRCKAFKGSHNRQDFLDLCMEVALHQVEISNNP